VQFIQAVKSIRRSTLTELVLPAGPSLQGTATR
jgi:hypothetical protein